MQQLFIQFINYVWYFLHVSALHYHLQRAFLEPSERCSIEVQSIEYFALRSQIATHHVTNHNTPIHNILSTTVGFSCIFILGILIFKGLTARCHYKSFGVKGLLACRSTNLLLSLHTNEYIWLPAVHLAATDGTADPLSQTLCGVGACSNGGSLYWLLVVCASTL
jgi:hypothetical protein